MGFSDSGAKNLIGNLPIFFQRKLQDILTIDPRQVFLGRPAVFIFSILIGSASHLFWDAFTHNNTYFTKTLPIYKGTYVPYEGVKYPLFYALQQISTAVGLAIVILYTMFRKAQKSVILFVPKISYWAIFLCIMIAVPLLRFSIYDKDYEIGNIVVSTVSGCCVAMVVCGLINFKNKPLANG